MPTKPGDERKSEGQGNEQSKERDLEKREYRDAEGNVHHHTHPYEQQHEGGKE
jgi:hypothetical protein